MWLPVNRVLVLFSRTFSYFSSWGILYKDRKKDFNFFLCVSALKLLVDYSSFFVSLISLAFLLVTWEALKISSLEIEIPCQHRDAIHLQLRWSHFIPCLLPHCELILENVFQFIVFNLQAENKFSFRQQLYKAVLVSICS